MSPNMLITAPNIDLVPTTMFDTEAEAAKLVSQPNIPMLRKQVEWVEEQAKIAYGKREWNQSYWRRDIHAKIKAYLEGDRDQVAMAHKWENSIAAGVTCGTSECLAGHVVHQTLREEEYYMAAGPQAPDHMYWIMKDGEVVDTIPIRAARELGLDAFQANLLFQADNKPEDIRRYAERFAGETL